MTKATVGLLSSKDGWIDTKLPAAESHLPIGHSDFVIPWSLGISSFVITLSAAPPRLRIHASYLESHIDTQATSPPMVARKPARRQRPASVSYHPAHGGE